MGDVHPGVTATNHPDEPHPAPCIVRAHSRQEQKFQTSEIFMSHGIEIQTKWFISAFWQVASTQQKEGQQNYIYTWFRARCLSYFISPNKKLKKKPRSSLNTIVLLGGAISMCSVSCQGKAKLWGPTTGVRPALGAGAAGSFVLGKWENY